MELSNLGGQGDAPVTRRNLLLILVKGCVLLGLTAFAAVFVKGLLAPDRDSADVIDVGAMAPGSADLTGWDGKPVWVVSRTRRQQRQLNALADYVVEPDDDGNPALDNPGRSLQPAFGIYLAQTSRPGVLIQYTRDRPPGLDAAVPWFGGFVDPASGACFDVAGRRYGAAGGGPLGVPPHHFVGPGIVRLGQW